MAIEFKYDDNGNVIAYENGKKIGDMNTMGTQTKKREDNKKDMADSKKIRSLLKKYGASDYEIENFMD